MLTVSEPLFALNPLIEYSFFVGDVFVGVTPEPVTPAILNLLFDDKLFWNRCITVSFYITDFYEFRNLINIPKMKKTSN